MIGSDRRVTIGTTNQPCKDHTVPYGTDHVYPLPGISCLATLVSSLWDGPHGLLYSLQSRGRGMPGYHHLISPG